MKTTIVITVVAVVFLTVLYRLLPFREADGAKPSFALLPKYRKRIKHALSSEALESELSHFGFKKVKESGSVSRFSRGSIMGDFSINLARVDVAVRPIAPGEHELTVQAGWVAAFDTGDLWQFITELARKLENA